MPEPVYKELFKLAEKEYLGTEPGKLRLPSSKPVLDGYRAEQFVVLKVAGKGLADYPQMKEEFYLIANVTINQCEEILKGESL